jgi:hypothetical protein
MSQRGDHVGASSEREPSASVRVLAQAAEAAVSDLERRLPTGMGPGERVEAARIRAAAQRLVQCVEQLAREELMVPGSTGQRRPHPLLKIEQELRREISDSLQKLNFRVEQRALLERLNAHHRRSRGTGGGDGVS